MTRVQRYVPKKEFEPVYVLDAHGLAAASRTEIRWLWHDYLAAGMVTLLTSRGKDGKTTLLSLLLERLQSQRLLAGAPVLARSAFVISEEPPEHWHIRAESLKLHRNVQWICRPLLERPEPSEWMAMLRRARDSRADLVAIDTLSHFLPDHRENHAERLLEAIRPLHQMTRTGQSILLMHHPRKGGPAGDINPRGSAALGNFADIAITLDRPRRTLLTDRCRILRSVCRLGGASIRQITLTPDGLDYTLAPPPPPDTAFEDGWSIVKTILEDTHRDLTQKEIQSLWPEDYATPSKITIYRWLRQAALEFRLQRFGTGRLGNPFRYRLPCTSLVPVP